MKTIFGLDPLLLMECIVLCVSLFCYVYGAITNNVSQVDRLWSILPVVYVWIYALGSNFAPIVVMMAFCVTLWGYRLTWNLYIKGGYAFSNGVFTDEDYRWNILRKFITNRFLWNLFHIFFICLFQLTLIAGFTSPVFLVAFTECAIPNITLADWGFVALFLLFLFMETTADWDMFKFQSAKYALTPEERLKSDDLRIIAGFNFTGLYKYSRHPNYFSEVMQWVVIYLWGSYHLGTWKNWGLVFVTVLAILVFCSTFVNEPVSRAKYPLYALYQKGTSRFIPLFPIGYSRFIQVVEKRRQSSVCSHTDQCT